MKRLASFGFVALLATVSCKGKTDPAPVPSALPAPPPAAAPAAANDSTDLPTSEDFEQKATDEINPQNMEQELDKLEKEIGQ